MISGSLELPEGRAAKDAAADRISMGVSCGWRSSRYQAQLFDDAVRTYGSRREAARWVAAPETSAHVSGDAVDVGPSAADHWLSRHGATYGLCQIYRNEPWHYELRPEAVDHGCNDEGCSDYPDGPISGEGLAELVSVEHGVTRCV